jgi:tetratricopeptide (TPR) repeat protein
LYISAVLLSGLASRAVAQSADSTTPAASADALYADRANLASAVRAADLWTTALANDGHDFDSAWKLARAYYWLGGHAPKAEERTYYEKAMNAAQKAIAIAPDKPEGHFWLAANMGALAESAGVSAGLKYRKPIKSELETVLRMNPAFLEGSADRALGRWYFKVPRLFGGSHKQAEEHLKAALKYKDDSTVTNYFLAELYADDNRVPEARAQLQKVLDAPIDPEWAPEDQEWKTKARQLLTSLQPRR